MREAKALGDKLVVIINNDNWLRLKKGFVFMPQKERAEIIRSLPFVDRVVFTDHKKKDSDMSVTRMLRKLKPTIFANGGDRTKTTTPEDSVCEELNIKRAYNVGFGGKVQSSSWMIGSAIKGVLRSVRPWGEFYGWNSGSQWYLKTIHVKPRKRLSLQYHNNRSECWVLTEGDAIATLRNAAGKDERVPLKVGEMFTVPRGAVHRLESKKGGTIVEIALGSFDENDIVRLHDDHGRI
jgi:mannose-6-phosphate isomerase-like protein (cupin superfamily)/glycerol-3-phosphate cytidylyltransferase-like family protein